MKREVNAFIQLQAVESVGLSDSKFPFSKCDTSLCFYNYPLKIFLPDSASESRCQWIYPVIFGGGLVEGDHVNISVEIKSRCLVLVATLSYPKVYCCENGLDSKLHMTFNVHSHALLCVLPDPVVCYKNASYIQTQTYNLKPDSNVVALDWFASGRCERGERWEFTKLKTSSLFLINKKLIFKEAQCLQNSPFLSIKKSMKNYNVCGTCLIMGPYLSFLFENILSVLGKGAGYGQKHDIETMFAVSPLILNSEKTPIGCIIRFTAVSVSLVSQKLNELLEPLFILIGGNPLMNK